MAAEDPVEDDPVAEDPVTEDVSPSPSTVDTPEPEEAAIEAEPPVAPRQRPLILGRRRSVVATALLFTLGAGSAYLLLRAIEQLRTVLIMLSLALLIALTLEPLVALLHRREPAALARRPGCLVARRRRADRAGGAGRAGRQRSAARLDQVGAEPAHQAESHLGSLGKRLQSLTSGNSVRRPRVTPRQGGHLRPAGRPGRLRRLRRRRHRRRAVAVDPDRAAAADRAVLPAACRRAERPAVRAGDRRRARCRSAASCWPTC